MTHHTGRIRAVGFDLITDYPPVKYVTGASIIAGFSEEECRANADEMARRWNAFEKPGGAVHELVKRATAMLWAARAGEYASAATLDLERAIEAVEPGAGAGREPQG